jgi:hypothetical protein
MMARRKDNKVMATTRTTRNHQRRAMDSLPTISMAGRTASRIAHTPLRGRCVLIMSMLTSRRKLTFEKGYQAPPHDSYQQHQQSQQHGYGAPPQGQYDQSYDPNRSHSPYPPPQQHLQGYQDPHQQQQQHGYGDQQQGYGAPQPAYGQQHGQPGAPGGPAEGDRGLGSTLIGGASGAFLGNKLGGGALGTIGGLVAGAIGANVLSDK